MMKGSIKLTNSHQQNNKVLKAVYNAFEMRQFNRAYKLTLGKSHSKWPIMIALRCHALERCGRTLESLLTLLLLMQSFSANNNNDKHNNMWSELEDRIWILRSTGAYIDEDIITKLPENGSRNRGVGSCRGKGKKNKDKLRNNASIVENPEESYFLLLEKKNKLCEKPFDLDIVDILDIPRWKRREMLSLSCSSVISNFSNDLILGSESFVDETTISTIAVTLRSLRLYDTLVNMYTLHSDKILNMKEYNQEELCNALAQTYFSYLRNAADYADLSNVESYCYHTSSNRNGYDWEINMMKEETIHDTKMVIHAYESAQLVAMQLSRHSGSRLHMSWCAHATLMHVKVCMDLISMITFFLSKANNIQNNALKPTLDVDLMSNNEHKSINSFVGKKNLELLKKKTEMKISMLPRLAESLMARVVALCSSNEINDQHPPSFEEWNLYLQSFIVQEKYDECMDVLQNVIQVYTIDGNSDNVDYINGSKIEVRRKVHDEYDLHNHMGSIVQMTERKRLEYIVELCKKMNKMNDASDIYINKLLSVMPNQWSYWIGLLESTIYSQNLSCKEASTKIDEVVSRVIYLHKQNHEKNITDSYSLDFNSEDFLHNNLRGPCLIRVEMATWYMSKCGNAFNSQMLAKTIMQFGDIYAPFSSCFQDLKSYVRVLIEKSDQNMKHYIPEEIMEIVLWTKKLRKKNNLLRNNASLLILTEGNQLSSNFFFKNLRTFIFTIQMSFEIWYLLQGKYGSKSTKRNEIDKLMSQYVPKVDEIFYMWKQSRFLVEIPKDGRQKDFFPGDDLILLLTQLIYHNVRLEGKTKQKAASFLVAALLEDAIQMSPSNPYLKVAALNAYYKLNAITRAWEMFKNIGVRHIQLDSCSYFIFSKLVEGGLYKEATLLSGSILNLHMKNSKEIGNYIAKCFENGHLTTGQEMINWQRRRMMKSLQLLEAKVLIMDFVLLFVPHHHLLNKDVLPLSVFDSIYGKETIERPETFLRDSDAFYAAPSLLTLSSLSSFFNRMHWSNNRDHTIYQFETLTRQLYISDVDICRNAILRAHIHGILIRVDLVVKAVKPPKKGKLAKLEAGESLEKRCRSLLLAINAGRKYIEWYHELPKCKKVLYNAIFYLSHAISVVSTGLTDVDANLNTDSINKREATCTNSLLSASHKIIDAREYFEFSSLESLCDVCNLFAYLVIPLFKIFESSETVFDLFGWGRRKYQTKIVSKALSDIASGICQIINDMKNVIELLPDSTYKDFISKDHQLDIVGTLSKNLSDTELKIMRLYTLEGQGNKMFDIVEDNVFFSHQCIRERLYPFLIQIQNLLMQ